MSRITMTAVLIQVLLRGSMYVCVCHAVTDRDIAQAVADGARSMRDLHERTGVAGTCGRCAQCAHACLKEASAAEAKTITLFRTDPALSVA
jgi:bacterioferritin-associated ferredoxin